MCNPTAGSPTITLCQLRPNYHPVFHLPTKFILNILNILIKSITKLIQCIN